MPEKDKTADAQRTSAATEAMCHPDVACPTCDVPLVPEHAHMTCPRCHYRDSCCM